MKVKEKVVQLVSLIIIESDQFIYRNEDSVTLLNKFFEKEGENLNLNKTINLSKLFNLDCILNKVSDVIDSNNKETSYDDLLFQY